MLAKYQDELGLAKYQLLNFSEIVIRWNNYQMEFISASKKKNVYLESHLKYTKKYEFRKDLIKQRPSFR